MSTIQSLTPADLTERAEFEYRPLHSLAIASAIFGGLSILLVLAARDGIESALMMTPLPLIGFALGVMSLRRIRATPDLLKGAQAAIAGIVLSVVFLAGGLAYAGYIHATEVPDGYARTSFAQLKPDEVDLRGNHIVPPEIAALDGKEVFIKGYIRPGTTYTNGGSPVSRNIKRFLLVRDNNQCCFGDISTVQYFDQMAVTATGPLTVDYSDKLFRVGGKLHIRPENAVNGTQRPVFTLEADHAE